MEATTSTEWSGWFGLKFYHLSLSRSLSPHPRPSGIWGRLGGLARPGESGSSGVRPLTSQNNQAWKSFKAQRLTRSVLSLPLSADAKLDAGCCFFFSLSFSLRFFPPLQSVEVYRGPVHAHTQKCYTLKLFEVRVIAWVKTIAAQALLFVCARGTQYRRPRALRWGQVNKPHVSTHSTHTHTQQIVPGCPQ